jgi:hypothetical protein
MRAVGRALRGVRPGRLVVALPLPADPHDLRWFREAAMPQLESRPLCLLIGAPTRRRARSLLGPAALGGEFRVLRGALSAGVIAAVARAVDAFVLPTVSPAPGQAPGGALGILLALGGVPVVTNEHARVLAHERNALVAEPGDERGFVRTLNQVLAMPAVQRHALGEEFARFTLAAYRPADAAAIYDERFASLVGRPQIPVGLRAA